MNIETEKKTMLQRTTNKNNIDSYMYEVNQCNENIYPSADYHKDMKLWAMFYASLDGQKTENLHFKY